MTDVDAIVEGLSEVERECLDWVRPHSLIAWFRDGRQGLVDKGIVTEGPSTGAMGSRWIDITPLGLAVRAKLEASNG